MGEEDREKTFHEMRDLAHKYAKAESHRVYLHEFRKSKKALLMKEAEVSTPGMASNKQEREAYAHTEYLALLKGLEIATEDALLCKLLYKNFELRFETWRTKQATKRAEMNQR